MATLPRLAARPFLCVHVDAFRVNWPEFLGQLPDLNHHAALLSIAAAWGRVAGPSCTGITFMPLSACGAKASEQREWATQEASVSDPGEQPFEPIGAYRSRTLQCPAHAARMLLGVLRGGPTMNYGSVEMDSPGQLHSGHCSRAL